MVRTPHRVSGAKEKPPLDGLMQPGRRECERGLDDGAFIEEEGCGHVE
jgi:hypothetical protein